ncbi:carbohydrate ABC transporter permease [Ruminiclostridium papyrosolvens]|uniref:ABC transporter permease n=1 Tax=Ruminiclostridium papyrosolvens C7 TaxID=1330534 RepID=U4R295_9FIRM|nr:carbohydrate ABC transporter permease [Ruminiclostridium papyrosolvens]EPR11675.1 ABC transporter permease [Ruminiclostridium papyrosolvens C7]
MLPILKKKEHYNFGDIVFYIITYLVFAALTIACIYPFYFLIINTLTANEISSKTAVLLLPQKIHFDNYVKILKLNGLTDALFVSVARTIIGAALTVFASAFLGYLFTKKEMWGRKFWYRFVIVTMYFNAGLIPWFITMLNLGLRNNFFAYILPAIVAPFNVILVKTYIENTPQALQEAAQIDGAGYFTIFIKVVWPLCVPILATVAIFAAVGQWNSFTDTLLLMTDSHLYTLQFILYRYLNQASSLASIMRNSGAGIGQSVSNLAGSQTAQSVRMTVSVVVILPILFVYPFFQRFFVGGIIIGAVKG